jgi:hypothetical protein
VAIFDEPEKGRLMKLKIFAGFLTSLLISSSASANLIDNGDFSNGFTGFTSAYTPQTDLTPPSVYTVGANPIVYHPSFVNLAPSTNPMLLVNGSETGGATVLAYSSPLLVAGDYFFGATVMNICCNATYNGPNAPSELAFQISTDGKIWTDPTKTWTDITTSFTGAAGAPIAVNDTFTANAPFSFRITDINLAFSGNDFAIDNLSITAVPGPVVGAGFPGLLMALGGLVVLARRRRMAAAGL